MVNIFQNITQKGTEAHFHQAMDAIPQVWQNHVQTYPSTAATETLVWPGFLPAPKEFISGRDLVGIRDFTFDVPNKEYELSFIIDRNSVEDDQHGAINARIAEAAEVWATFKDSQFSSLLHDAESTTLGIDTLDSLSFHNATRTIGDSGTIDNTETSIATPGGTIPTTEEILTALQGDIAKMALYNDDTGRPFNAAAMMSKRLIIPPAYERSVVEAMNSTFVARSSAGVSNPWGAGLCEIDVLPYLADTDAYYLSFVGATRMPFIYQQRTELEIVVLNSREEIAKNGGVLVLTRQRYRLGYGDPRRNLRHDFT